MVVLLLLKGFFPPIFHFFDIFKPFFELNEISNQFDHYSEYNHNLNNMCPYQNKFNKWLTGLDGATLYLYLALMHR